MATPLHTPRVNNNDDSVRLVKLMVRPGDPVRSGQIVAEVETDKANFTVEADRDGYVLGVEKTVNDTVAVGSVLLWLGERADDRPPARGHGSSVNGAGGAPVPAEPTLKAAQMLAKHGLAPGEVPARGDRLTVSDVEAFLAARAATPSATASSPLAPGDVRPLTPEERGMLRTVRWQRDEAVPAYVETTYDAYAWEAAASEYQRRERLLLSPLLAMIAHQLVRLAATDPRLNSTIAGDARHVYRSVNLGFTIQSETTLYLAVVQNASAMSSREFIDTLGRLQRGALAHSLRAPDLTGATIAFSSMARWDVTRHVPVLPPYTSLIVAHAAARDGHGTLGATYDHRALTGYDALSVIQALAAPEEIA